MTGRRRLVRSTGILADQKADREALAALIEEWYDAPNYTPEAELAQRIIDAGYRRVVVDDAMVERAAGGVVQSREYIAGAAFGVPSDASADYVRAVARAALVAALGTDR